MSRQALTQRSFCSSRLCSFGSFLACFKRLGMRSGFRRSWPALALVALALAARCYHLTAPLLDYHSWRQADTAAIARNYVVNGYRILYPQVDWGGLTRGYVESEFPLYTFTLALLYGSFGIHEWLGRLLTAIAGAGSAVALYGLIQNSSAGDDRSRDAAHSPASARNRVATYAGLALALMPFPIYFGRTVMPDTWMLLTAILAIWTFRRWLERPSAGRYAIALLCGALAPLAKTPNLLIVATPLAYMLCVDWIGRRRSTVERPQRRYWSGALAVYGLCFVVPSLLWLNHARSLPLDPRLSFGIGEKLFDAQLLLDIQFYLLLGRWSVEHVITLAGLPFFLLGLVPRTENHPEGIRLRSESREPEPRTPTSESRTKDYGQPKFALLPHFWLIGVVLFFFAGASGVVGQDYYILPLAGPAAWFVGVGLDRAQRLLEKRLQFYRRDREDREELVEPDAKTPSISVASFSWLVPGLGLIGLAVLSFLRIMPLYHITDFYQTLGRRIDLALPVGARVGVIAPAVSEIFYYGERQGWRLDPGVLVPGGLASLPPDLGVRYVLVADPALTERRDVLTAALREYRRVPIGPYALLLDLATPGLQRPAEMIWETGHLVEEPFLSYMRTAGGVEGIGYPLSDALDGPNGREQYFERELLLLENDRVKRLLVGRLLLEAQGHAPQPAEVAEPFRMAWEQAGGEKALGAPLSPPLDESGLQVQYFEFGILEAPPGSSATIGAAGRRLLEARGLTEERQIELATKAER
jgi:4-amino-4-deoxy-L-arabinose transferase-like glycosyltransferase